MSHTYEAAGKTFTSRAKAEKYVRNIAGVRVPVYETTGALASKSNKLSTRELATVLAALRLYQQADPVLGGVVIGSDQFSAIEVIATNGGACEPLTPTEIDSLCERLNR